jgi:hypothetical protein
VTLLRPGLRTVVLSSALAASALALAVFDTSSLANDEQRRRFVVRTGPETSLEFPGLPLWTIHAPLLQGDGAGEQVGTLDALMVFTLLPPEDDPEGPASGIVQAVVKLPTGDIAIQGTIDSGDGPFKLAVTGGTRAFRNARGYVRVTPTEEDQGSRIAFYVTPRPR